MAGMWRLHRVGARMGIVALTWAALKRRGRSIVRFTVGLRHGSVLDMTAPPNPYRSFRFPAEIIEQAGWL